MSVPTFGVGPEHGALGLHLGQAPVETELLHLELGDAVAQQPADPVGPLEHRDVVADAGELLGGGQPGGPGPDDRDLLARLGRRRAAGTTQPCPPRVVHDLQLDLLDRHRVAVDRQHAGGLARRRAQRPGELREVVRGVQPLDRLAPLVAVDEVVPLRDEVAQRAALVAERDAAVHAAPGLLLQPVVRELLVDLAPVLEPQVHRTPGGGLTGRGEEPFGSPMCGLHDRLVRVAAVALGRLARLQDPLEVLRHDLREALDGVVPVGEQPGPPPSRSPRGGARRRRAAPCGRPRRAGRCRPSPG